MTMAAPTIETERLSLQAHRVEDLDDCIRMWADPDVTRHVGGRASTPEETWTRVLRYAGHWPLMGFGYWAVRETTSGRFVGEVGWADLKRDMSPSLDGAPEMGWALASWAHGKGFATEAARAVVSWGLAQFGARRLVCLIGPENIASLRVARKLGFVECGRTTYKGEPTLVHELRRGGAGIESVPT